MANRLKIALIEAILSLKARGWSNRRFARELDVDRATVSRQMRANAARAPIGSTDAQGESNAASAHAAETVAEKAPEGSNAAKAPIERSTGSASRKKAAG